MTTRKAIEFLSLALIMAITIPLAGCAKGKTTRDTKRSGGVAASQAARAVHVAAAGDLRFAMEELAKAFEKTQPDIRLEVSYGSSGNFYAQIENGAPFDIFFSADVKYPQKLAEKGLALPGSEFVYGVGRIVLWVPRSSTLDIGRKGVESLRHPSVRHVAIANPQHAPYGRAAEDALKNLGVYDDLRGKLVFGENVAQTAQMVQSGGADAGVIALSLALSPAMRGQGHYWEFPLSSYPRMDQGGVILKRTRDPEAAKALRAFVLSDSGRAILKRYGFYLPDQTGQP